MTSPSQRFRKKPLEIEAYQLTEQKEIKTREGTLMGYPGDWIVTGIQGEIYPVGKEIFEMTYEPVDCSSHIPITERDKVLGELLVWVKKNNINYEDVDGDRLPAIVTGKIMNKIEELRTAPEQL